MRTIFCLALVVVFTSDLSADQPNIIVITADENCEEAALYDSDPQE